MKTLRKSYNDGSNEFIIKFNDDKFSSESVHFSYIDTAHNINISTDKIRNNYWFTVCILPVIYLIDRIDKYEATDLRSIGRWFNKVINRLPSLVYSSSNMNSWNTLNDINKLIEEYTFSSLFMKKAYGAIIYAYTKAIRERLSRIEFICNIHADSPNTVFRLSTLEIINNFEVYELISYSDFKENDNISLSSFEFHDVFCSKTVVNKYIMPLDGGYFDKDLLYVYFKKLHIMDSAYVEDVNSGIAHFSLDDPRFNKYQEKFTDSYLKIMYTELVYEDRFKDILQYYDFTID